jgi:Zn-dependent peptidase ImmA (M78 family)
MKKTSADLPGSEATAKHLIIANRIEAAPVPIPLFLQNEGYSIYAAEFAEQIIISGFIDLDKECIIINEIDDPSVQNLTLARALGHLIMHRDELDEIPELKVIYQQSLGGELKNFYEKEALHFAYHLLIPEYLYQLDLSLSDDEIAAKYLVPQFVIGHIRKWKSEK